MKKTYQVVPPGCYFGEIGGVAEGAGPDGFADFVEEGFVGWTYFLWRLHMGTIGVIQDMEILWQWCRVEPERAAVQDGAALHGPYPITMKEFIG